MKYEAQIPVAEKSIRMTTTFGGYNHTDVITDGEMYDTQNMSARAYPMLAPRKQRGITSWDAEGQTSVPLTGIHGRDQLVFIRGTEVFYNLAKVAGISVSTNENMMPKKIVSMGAYVCIWPDKVYFNTVDLNDRGSMERRLTTGGSGLSAVMCRGDGTDYDMTQIAYGTDAPASPNNGDLWMDESGENDVLRQYSAATLEWVEVPSVYVKIQGTGIGAGLKEYDAVNISGLEAPATETEKVQRQADALNGSAIIYAAGENYVVIAGLISNSLQALKDQDVSIDRTVPDLDYICESNNRLWGCIYGIENGAVVNEIRASKLGDFRNWQTFMGLSTDSYAASIGTDGPFTGAISQRGYPVFFKENAIHRVSGMTPSSFSIQTTNARGVQAGSWRSLAIVSENIYYKSRDGIMLYDGNMPVSVSDRLGGVLYSDARAGTLKEIYYISMKDAEEHWHLFTYDTGKGIWYKEDGLKALGFASVQDELYCIDEEHNAMIGIDGTVLSDDPTQGRTEDAVEWAAEFGLSGVEYQPTNFGKGRADVAAHHYMSRFDIRMSMEAGKTAQLEIMYDSDGIWTKQGTIRGSRMQSFVLPVIPRRCDHLRFRIRGSGEMRIYSIARYVEVGADG